MLITPRAGEQVRVARVPRRHDAIEHVDAAQHRLDDVLRPADAHQVARLVPRASAAPALRARAGAPLRSRRPRGRRWRGPAKPICLERLERCRAQVARARRPARCRTECPEGPPRSTRDGRAAPSASTAPSKRAPRFGRRIRRAFIEAHRDVGAEHALDAHRLLGRQEHRRAVDRRAKARALLGDLAHLLARLHTWKPPESVRMGRSQPMKPCRPRCARSPRGRGARYR